MKLTCPSCGRRYASVDEPAPGRVYSLRCACGNGIVVAGSAPAAAPGAGPTYDAHAASHGLLIDEAEAAALAGGDPILEPAVDAAPWGDVEVTLTFSTALPLPAPEKEKAPARREVAAPPIAPPAAAAIPPAWIVPAAALIAFLAVGGATAWLLLPGTTLTSALATMTSRLQGAPRDAPSPPPPRPAEPASPPPAAAASLPGPGEVVPWRAAPVEPARQRPAETPSAPRDGATRARTKVAVRQRPVGQR